MKYLEISSAFTSSSMSVGQILDIPKTTKSDYVSFLLENKSLIPVIFIGYLITLLAFFIFLQTLYCEKAKNLKLNVFSPFFIGQNKLRLFSSKISLIYIFFTIFLFIIITLFSNSIKTDSVIVSTSEIIDSISKLKETDKIPCFYEGKFSFNHNLIGNSFLFSRPGETEIER